MITKEQPAIVMVFPERISITVLKEKMVAAVFKPVGAFQVQQSFEKAYSHANDLHHLRLAGVIQLAQEFYEEIKQQLTA